MSLSCIEYYMGVKYFFVWFRKNHGDCLRVLNRKRPVVEQGVDVDVLGLDMNGIFHPCAQKIFEYGSGKRNERFLKPRRKKPYKVLEEQTFKEICNQIDSLVHSVRPKKQLLLCIDGVAGTSKMTQQRSRRFKSAQERDEDAVFDSCSITPGTPFMNRLCRYMDRYIRIKMMEDPLWRGLDILFSSEKQPGEGEHKIKNFIRKNGNPHWKYAIYGLDADLFMLSLAIGRDNVMILRENPYNANEIYHIDIGRFANKLKKELGTKNAIADFILLCFLVGNDFLPSVPSMEILLGGIQTMIETYQKVCAPMGIVGSDGVISWEMLADFFQALEPVEHSSLIEKYHKRGKYFKDELMEAYFEADPSVLDERGRETVHIDFEQYTRAYYTKKFPSNPSREQICHEFLYGMQWVIHYYLYEIPQWNWTYPYHYAPFIRDLHIHTRSMKRVSYPVSKPYETFQQLLSVIPPQSYHLLPKPLQPLVMDDTSPLAQYYPSTFEIDLSGKKAEWEGVVLVPMIDQQTLTFAYQSARDMLSESEQKRNRPEKMRRYHHHPEKKFYWKNRYGDIEQCCVSFTKIN